MYVAQGISPRYSRRFTSIHSFWGISNFFMMSVSVYSDKGDDTLHLQTWRKIEDVCPHYFCQVPRRVRMSALPPQAIERHCKQTKCTENCGIPTNKVVINLGLGFH